MMTSLGSLSDTWGEGVRGGEGRRAEAATEQGNKATASWLWGHQKIPSWCHLWMKAAGVDPKGCYSPWREKQAWRGPGVGWGGVRLDCHRR